MATIVGVVARCRRVARIVYMGYLEARPVVQIIFLVRFLTGASLADSSDSYGENQFSLWFGALAWSCATCAGYILNGITDVAEDRINGSKRPIASGKLSVAQAAVTAAVLAGLALIASTAVGDYMIWGVATLLVMSWMYSAPPLRLKRWPAGLAALAIISALLTYYLGYAAKGGEGNARSLAAFALTMALWMGLVGQTKDLSDVKGDEQAGRRSLPVVWGENRARIAVSGTALAIGGAFLALVLFVQEVPLAPAVVVAVGAVAVTVTTLGRWSKGSREKRRRPYRMFMLTQYGAHLTVIVPASI